MKCLVIFSLQCFFFKWFWFEDWWIIIWGLRSKKGRRFFECFYSISGIEFLREVAIIFLVGFEGSCFVSGVQSRYGVCVWGSLRCICILVRGVVLVILKFCERLVLIQRVTGSFWRFLSRVVIGLQESLEQLLEI